MLHGVTTAHVASLSWIPGFFFLSQQLMFELILDAFPPCLIFALQVNKGEQARLRDAGANLAPLGFHLQGPARPQEMGVGPLRMWPGGLCVSRSIGDIDAGASAATVAGDRCRYFLAHICVRTLACAHLRAHICLHMTCNGALFAGPLIVPLPHVRQVLLSRSRALRLVLASDGLWDLMTFRCVLLGLYPLDIIVQLSVSLRLKLSS